MERLSSVFKFENLCCFANRAVDEGARKFGTGIAPLPLNFEVTRSLTWGDEGAVSPVSMTRQARRLEGGLFRMTRWRGLLF